MSDIYGALGNQKRNTAQSRNKKRAFEATENNAIWPTNLCHEAAAILEA